MHTLPPLFISHGSPMTALEPREAGHFMQRLGPAIEAAFGRPSAVLAISAHSLTREPALLAAPRHEAVYDFGGFDPKLRTLRYDAPGAPALAPRVAWLVQAAGIPVHVVEDGGLDHGIWTPLRYMFPAADIPVLPLAWPPMWRTDALFKLGQALAPLAGSGVLILASGSITHNLRRVFCRRPAGRHRSLGHSAKQRLSRLVRGQGCRCRLGRTAALPHAGPARGTDAPHR